MVQSVSGWLMDYEGNVMPYIKTIHLLLSRVEVICSYIWPWSFTVFPRSTESTGGVAA